MTRKRGTTRKTPAGRDHLVSFYFSGLPESEFAYYGSSFHEAARKLVRSLRRKDGFSSVEALPALFLYRHAIELFLKAIIIHGEGLLWSPGADRFRDMSHDLSTLVSRVGVVLRERSIEWWWPKSAVETWIDVERLVKFLSRHDPRASAFRYPITKSGDRSVHKDFSVGFFAFVSVLDSFAAALECAEMAVSEA